MLRVMNASGSPTRDESAPSRDASCAGERWDVLLPILGHRWVTVTVRGYVDGPTRTRDRISDEGRLGRLTAGLVAPNAKPKKKTKKQQKAEEPLPAGSWSLQGAWKIDPPMLHGAKAPWGWIVDSGDATWRRPQ
jgi:hypothetical protein